MRLLFVHGAGGYVTDRPLAEALGEALGADVDLPRLSAAGWAAVLRPLLAALDPDDAVIAHSFGASILLHVLAGGGVRLPERATLLAMPDWTPDGWDIAEYALDAPEPRVALTLHHCRDDEEVPFDHLALNSARLPSARVREHAVGGHQFDGLAAVVAADVLRDR